MEKKTALIFNPSAGGGKALRRKRRVEAALADRDIKYDLFVTESEEHLVQTAKNLVEKYPVIIGAGGDTTLNIIATQIHRAQKGNTLGLISLGSVNDLSRELGVFKLEDAVNAIKMGVTREIDLGHISALRENNNRYFLVSASMGLGVAVNRYVDIWMRNHPFFSTFRSATQGTAAMSGIRHAFKTKEVPLNLSLETQGVIHSVVSPLMVFCNASSFGGSFRPSPNASLLSGQLDCCILRATSFSTFFKVSIDVKRQKHLDNDNVKVMRDKTFIIRSEGPLEFQLDGEITQLVGDVEISILPKALTVITNPAYNG